MLRSGGGDLGARQTRAEVEVIVRARRRVFLSSAGESIADSNPQRARYVTARTQNAHGENQSQNSARSRRIQLAPMRAVNSC